MTLTVACDGSSETIVSRFVLACDGLNSTVLATLRRATAARKAAPVRSKAGFDELRWKTSNSRLLRKTLVMPPEIADLAYARAPARPTPERSAGTGLSLLGKNSGATQREFCDIAVFSLGVAHVEQCGGRIGSVIAPPEHAVWRLSDVEQAYD